MADFTQTDEREEGQEKVVKPVMERLVPPTSLRTLRQILQDFGKSDGENVPKRILDPEHPLMLKYQKDLKEHLLKLHKETEEQIANLNKAIGDQYKSTAKVAEHVCNLQKELAHTRDSISAREQECKTLLEKKEKNTTKLNKMKESHKNLQNQLMAEKEKDYKLQKNLEDLSLQVVQLKQLQLESYSDTATMKRAFEKCAKDRENLEIEKLRQDILIARMEEDLVIAQDRISLYKSQCAIKKEELSDLRKLLHSAGADIETMHFEKLHLMQQWNYSISTLEKRDMTAAVIRDLVKKCEDNIQTLNMDITSHKKSIRKELEENENLSVQLLQRESDVVQVQNLLKESQIRQRNLEEQYMVFEEIVQKAENDLQSLENDKIKHERELEKTTKQVEKACIQLKKLESEYVNVLHEKITASKASRYSERLMRECKEELESLETKYVLKEGEEAKLRLKYGEAKAHLQALEDNLTMMKNEYEDKEKTVAKSDAEIARERIMIEKKQIYILELNRKLTDLISEAGGAELGPLEREIASLKKEILSSEKLRKIVEQEWLRYQRELVSLTNEASDLSKEINLLHKKEAVLEEKKIRIGADLTREENEIKELTRSIERTQNDMRRLTAVLYREKDSQERLEQEAMLLKGDFLKMLRDSELEFARKEQELQGLKKKHNLLLQKLCEMHQEKTMWEEKLQATESARKLMRSYASGNEAGYYKSEVQRLQLRWDQIKREQGSVIQQMEKAAFQHVSLYVRADIQPLQEIKTKSKQYLSTKAERLEKKLVEGRKQLESIKKEITAKNDQIYELKHQEEAEKTKIVALTQQKHLLDYDFQKKEREKWQSIILLSAKHKKNKLLQKLQENKYIWSLRNQERREREIENVLESLSDLQNITNSILTMFPDLRDKLLKVIDHTIVAFKI